MADVFISYSQLDRDKVALLASYLEAEGWTVWFDKALSAGDGYRDEIMRQLTAARAVIVLWTQNSITSDFVRAEAGRAKADGKLIPVKAADVDYGSIPLPFGEMHTENLTQRELIRAAIVGQLAKPQAARSSIYLATAEIRYAAFTWIGVIGGAITLFANVKGIIQLADWARVLVEQWATWTHTVWRWLFAWLAIELPREYGPYLTFAAFMASAVAGTYFSISTVKGHGKADASLQPSVPRERRLKLVLITLAYGGPSLLLLLGQELGMEPEQLSISLVMWLVVLGFVAGIGGLSALIYISRERVGTIVFIIIYHLMFVIIAVLPAERQVHRNPEVSTGPLLTSFVILLAMFMPLALALAPAKRLNRRLIFVLIGFGLLIGLNELSKLNLGQYLKT